MDGTAGDDHRVGIYYDHGLARCIEKVLAWIIRCHPYLIADFLGPFCSFQGVHERHRGEFTQVKAGLLNRLHGRPAIGAIADLLKRGDFRFEDVAATVDPRHVIDLVAVGKDEILMDRQQSDRPVQQLYGFVIAGGKRDFGDLINDGEDGVKLAPFAGLEGPLSQ